jgi:hypothetical protein
MQCTRNSGAEQRNNRVVPRCRMHQPTESPTRSLVCSLPVSLSVSSPLPHPSPTCTAARRPSTAVPGGPRRHIPHDMLASQETGRHPARCRGRCLRAATPTVPVAASPPRCGAAALLTALVALSHAHASPRHGAPSTTLPVGPIIPNDFAAMWVYTYVPTNFSVPQMGFVGLVNGMDFAWRVSGGSLLGTHNSAAHKPACCPDSHPQNHHTCVHASCFVVCGDVECRTRCRGERALQNVVCGHLFGASKDSKPLRVW